MLTRPNPTSGVPTYIQLVQQVKHALETGALQPGQPLPGIRPLAETLVVSPNTVARAYRELENESLIDWRGDAGDRWPCVRESAGPPRGQVSGRLERPASYGRAQLRELATENSRLAAEVAAIVADRVRRDRELDHARQVQQRLMPQEYPPIAGLDYAGSCRPALGVGGDYYDFIPLSETVLAFAIGDVSGKGMPAALLMATLRAYLRSLPLCCFTSPAHVVGTLNRLVCESFASNRYATFFYAYYDASSRTLDYVNAGHNPPLVFATRRGCGAIIRLDSGGPVIGFTPECGYAQGHVALERDDLVVAFTDGISEAMNAAGDEWGEERLIQAIEANRGLSTRGLIERVMCGADAFAGGASQYDDMTFVSIRIG